MLTDGRHGHTYHHSLLDKFKERPVKLVSAIYRSKDEDDQRRESESSVEGGTFTHRPANVFPEV